jgi:hypothetical protein
MKGERVLAKINPTPRSGKSAAPPLCRLFPQEQVYCCTAVSEAVGQNRPPALQRGHPLTRMQAVVVTFFESCQRNLP